MLKKWEIKNKKLLHDFRIFNVSQQESYHVGKDINYNFMVLGCCDWVNVIPLTRAGQIVLIKQYRAGTHDFSLEVPAGQIEKGETPTQAGLRELTEETGFVSVSYEELGFVHPNPAIQGNRCHYILAKDCELKAQTNFDNVEDIETVLTDLKDVPQLIAESKITHALVWCALMKLAVLKPEYRQLLWK